jgi:hypothetical protein
MHATDVSAHRGPSERFDLQGIRVVQENIELDRAMASQEAGFRVQLLKLRQPELTTKSDVIVGVPAELCPGKFRWPWRR